VTKLPRFECQETILSHPPRGQIIATIPIQVAQETAGEEDFIPRAARSNHRIGSDETRAW
jgi:hypothetical protein